MSRLQVSDRPQQEDDSLFKMDLLQEHCLIVLGAGLQSVASGRSCPNNTRDNGLFLSLTRPDKCLFHRNKSFSG